MLTKEECEKALDRRKEAYENVFKVSVIERDNEFYEDIDTIQQLINEHFDNPPLKFEDLHDEMWVWDNEIKEYIKLEKHCAKGLGYLGYDLKINDIDWFDLEFEENRFYLREVKE